MSGFDNQRLYSDLPPETVRSDVTPEMVRADLPPGMSRPTPVPLPLPSPVTGVPRRRYAGVVATAVVAFLISGAVGLAVYRIVELAASSFGTGATTGADAPTAWSTDIPPALAAALASAYPDWKVEKAFVGSRRSFSVTEAVVAVLASDKVTGFRRRATLEAAVAPRGPALLTPDDDSIFDPQGLGYMPQMEAGFEKLWVQDHPGLLCGPVDDDLSRDVAAPLEAYTADGFKNSGPGVTEKAGTFSFRYDPTTQVWDTSTSRTLPPAITPQAARAKAEKLLPAFRFVTSVTNPAAVDPDVGDVFVVMRHPSYPGFSVVLDPLLGTLKESAAIMDDSGSPQSFFKKLDTRSRAFMRDWAKLHPGSVVFEVDDYVDSGTPFDDVGVTYYTSVADIASSDFPGGDVELVYDRAHARWKVVPD